MTLELIEAKVCIGFSEKPTDAFVDPRCEQLGWRQYYLNNLIPRDSIDFKREAYDKLRVKYCIPETNIELIRDKTFILEAGFDRLSGVSFTKGCYVGQEVTARMRHKTELQKGLVKVRIIGNTDGLCESILSEDRVVGTLLTRVKDLAIAYIKFKK